MAKTPFGNKDFCFQFLHDLICSCEIHMFQTRLLLEDFQTGLMVYEQISPRGFAAGLCGAKQGGSLITSYFSRLTRPVGLPPNLIFGLN